MTTLDISPEAATTIERMFEAATKTRYVQGVGTLDREEQLKREHSLLAALKSMIGLGGRITVAHDLPELSLYGVNEYGLNYGIVYDPRDHTWSVNS